MNTDQQQEDLPPSHPGHGGGEGGEDLLSPLRALRDSVVDPSSSVAICAPSVADPLLPLPEPRRAIEVVPATMADVDWIDSLQKRHRDRVGFQMRGAIEGK